MGANARRRHLERIIKRSVPKQSEIPPLTREQLVRFNPRIKRAVKLFAVFGWLAALWAVGMWWVWWAYR